MTIPPADSDTERRHLHFSLRELVIVVALICLLLLAGSPWYNARKVRAGVSRTRTDMRNLATAIEAYNIDNTRFPACGMAEGTPRFFRRSEHTDQHYPVGVVTANSHAPQGSGARRGVTFRLLTPTQPHALPHTLTTPLAYLSQYPLDGFADSPKVTYGFFSETSGWFLWSPGPDRDENSLGGPGDIGERVFGIYRGEIAQPSDKLRLHDYDPTNGVISDGDIFRVRQ